MPENKSKQKTAISSHGKDDHRTFVQTRTVDDVFTDGVEMVKPKFEADYRVYLVRLWEANSDLQECLQKADSLEDARDAVFEYLEKAERQVFTIDNDLHILEKSTVRECIRVFKSIIGPINEKRCGVSALEFLWKLARDTEEELHHDVSVGFLMEFINLFRGVAGRSNIYFESRQAKKGIPDFLKLEGREAAEVRTEKLDEVGATINKYFKKFPSGLDTDVISWRKDNRKRILNYYNGTEEDWQSYTWQIKHVIRDAEPLFNLIELSAEQKEAIEKTGSNRIPFGITPYYVSLMDRHQAVGHDHAIRAQVLPPPDYVNMMTAHESERDIIFDFMGEHDTSPIDLVTRRYPGIAILKPFNTCAQICVYCQRNWEIDEVLAPKALADKETIDEALAWFDEHPAIGDVLITGGDPCIMSDSGLERILTKIAEKKQVYRIRIGTRTPVVLPMRWTDNFMKMISKFHEPGRREIAIVTHFEHPYEITPEAMIAVQKIKKSGISVYNQQVFTVENSRRFESAKLRRDLRLIGVDPYYTFNMKFINP